MKTTKIKPNEITNRQDIFSYQNMEFFTSKTFTTVSDFIFTYDKPVFLSFGEDGEEIWDFQSIYITTATHQLNATPYEIQKNILKSAIKTLNDSDKKVLVKVSSCTHYTERYEKEVSEKIKIGCEMYMGKWYFQPDQRRKTESEVINENPIIAKLTRPFEEVYTPVQLPHVSGEMS